MAYKSKAYAIRSQALSFIADPFLVESTAAYHYESDALIIIENGKIKSFGSYDQLKSGDDRAIKAVYLAGDLAYEKNY